MIPTMIGVLPFAMWMERAEENARRKTESLILAMRTQNGDRGAKTEEKKEMISQRVDSKPIMTPEEIHDFGLQIVRSLLEKDGYEIAAVNTDTDKYPSIVGLKGAETAFILVRTACYPEKGQVAPHECAHMITHAEKSKATPYLASVGICNCDAKTEAEKSIPVKGAGFSVMFDGLYLVMPSDRVHVAKKK